MEITDALAAAVARDNISMDRIRPLTKASSGKAMNYTKSRKDGYGRKRLPWRQKGHQAYGKVAGRLRKQETGKRWRGKLASENEIADVVSGWTKIPVRKRRRSPSA